MRKQTHVRQQRQHLAISALVEGKSPDAAAEAAGVHRSTIFRWLARDDFQRALARAKGEPARPSSGTPRTLQRPPYHDEPAVREAAKAYRQAARDHFGPDVPVCTRTSVPDPRWWLRLRDAGELHSEVAQASQRYERVRVEALRRWRKERDGAQAKG